MDKELYDFFKELFKGKDESIIIKLLSEDKTNDEILRTLLDNLGGVQND